MRATNEWFEKFPDTKVYHLDVTTSNHKPLWVVPEIKESYQQRPFRFEQMWMTENGCSDTIEAVWRSGDSDPRFIKLLNKVDRCGIALAKWSKTIFGSVRAELKKKRKLLQQSERRAIQGGSTVWMRTLDRDINELMDKEAKMWAQQAHVSWLKDGDRNTNFFYTKDSQRRRRNHIKGLCDNNNRWCTQKQGIIDTVVDFYQSLFTSANLDSFDEVLDEISHLVTLDMNAQLTDTFLVAEVEAALKEMALLKAPGPDGMPSLFYQSYWSLVGSDVIEAILHYLNTGSLPQSLCHSFIALIPKVKNPELISQYRPICLSNMLFRVFLKVLANRLKSVFPGLISKHQPAFLTDRLISDNIMVAFETLHYMRNHSSGKTGFMALKLDMSKAYDHVEWAFIEKLMIKMGFNKR